MAHPVKVLVVARHARAMFVDTLQRGQSNARRYFAISRAAVSANGNEQRRKRGARMPMFCPEQTGCEDVATIPADMDGRGHSGELRQCVCRGCGHGHGAFRGRG